MADRRLELWGLLAVTLAGGAVWLAYHPDHPALVRTARWPLVGGAVEAFRERFAPPPRAMTPASTQRPPAVVLELRIPEPPLSRRAASPRSAAAEPRSIVPVEIDRTPLAVGPLPALAADPDRLARIRELLGSRVLEGELGPYRWIGDREPPSRWSQLAAALDAAYAERTGVEPIGAPAETVAVFAARTDYRELQRSEEQLAGLDPDGHAGHGIAALALESEPGAIAEATLVHELVHFVHRRALGPALPPWLEEGLAEDLAWTRFEAARGGFLWGEVRPGLHRQGSRLVMVGAVAGLDRLAADHARGELPTLAELVALDWSEFVGPGAERRYAHARLLVGFLLDDRRTAAGFRAFLAGIATGGDVDRAALEAALGRGIRELEMPFRAALLERKAREVDHGVRALTAPGESVRPEREPA